MQVEELRPPMAFKSLFSSPDAQFLQYRKTRPATSRTRTHKGQGRPQFFNLHKIHKISVKKHPNNMSE